MTARRFTLQFEATNAAAKRSCDKSVSCLLASFHPTNSRQPAHHHSHMLCNSDKTIWRRYTVRQNSKPSLLACQVCLHFSVVCHSNCSCPTRHRPHTLLSRVTNEAPTCRIPPQEHALWILSFLQACGLDFSVFRGAASIYAYSFTFSAQACYPWFVFALRTTPDSCTFEVQQSVSHDKNDKNSPAKIYGAASSPRPIPLLCTWHCTKSCNANKTKPQKCFKKLRLPRPPNVELYCCAQRRAARRPGAPVIARNITCSAAQ